jgi:hypothetical protein
MSPGAVFSAARRAVPRFALTPARPAPLAALRIGLALVLLAQATMIAPWYRALYAYGCVIPAAISERLSRPGVPHLHALTRLLAPAGLGEGPILAAVGAAYLLALAGLLLGLGTRISAALVWSLHLMLLESGEGTNYGADQLAHVFLFYLIWAPSGAALSLDRLLGWARPGPSPEARLALRVVQLHLCVIYLSGGVAKALSRAWWDGDSIWRAVMSPEYRQFDFSWLASHPWVAVGAGWGVLVVESGYAVLIWPRATRRLWVAAMTALHLGIAVFMGLTVFGAIMIVLTVAAFGVSAEPGAAASRG